VAPPRRPPCPSPISSGSASWPRSSASSATTTLGWSPRPEGAAPPAPDTRPTARHHKGPPAGAEHSGCVLRLMMMAPLSASASPDGVCACVMRWWQVGEKCTQTEGEGGTRSPARPRERVRVEAPDSSPRVTSSPSRSRRGAWPSPRGSERGAARAKAPSGAAARRVTERTHSVRDPKQHLIEWRSTGGRGAPHPAGPSRPSGAGRAR
jgi:hypothetical protein